MRVVTSVFEGKLPKFDFEITEKGKDYINSMINETERRVREKDEKCEFKWKTYNDFVRGIIESGIDCGDECFNFQEHYIKYIEKCFNIVVNHGFGIELKLKENNTIDFTKSCNYH